MASTQAGSSRRWLLPAVLSLVALVAAGVLWQDTRARGSERATAVDSAVSATSTPSPVSASPTTSTTPAARPRTEAVPGAGPPRRVVVTSLGIDAPVVPIETQGTSLTPPDDPQVLGWWSGGAPVGAVRGTALITGHTVNAGGGAMDELEALRPGARIEVRTATGNIPYVARSVQVLDKEALASRAQELFSQEVRGRLVLVTCEDWDGTGYRSNVVVTAVPR